MSAMGRQRRKLARRQKADLAVAESGNSFPGRNQTGRSMSRQCERASASIGVWADAGGEGPISPARAPARMLGKE